MDGRRSSEHYSGTGGSLLISLLQVINSAVRLISLTDSRSLLHLQILSSFRRGYNELTEVKTKKVYQLWAVQNLGSNLKQINHNPIYKGQVLNLI